MLKVNDSWINTYRSMSTQWTCDSLNYDTNNLFSTFNQPIISFINNSSFISQYFMTDSFIKLSHIDIILINMNSSYFNYTQSLYIAYYEDILFDTTIHFLPLSSLLTTEYQDNINMVFLVSPEVSLLLNDYIYSYILSTSFSTTTNAVFDAYMSNLIFYIGNSFSSVFFYGLYIWLVIYILISTVSLRWSVLVNPQPLRWYYSLFSTSVETRMQFEVILQTILFFIIYWVIALMTYDDNQEDVLEFMDTNFYLFFNLTILYLLYKYSTHYFTFLEASIANGRSVSFFSKQVVKDFINTLALFLRFYILLLRINVYDTLDDFLDSYYIFIGDFDEDEYINEAYFSIYESLLFTAQNDYDISYLNEDESDSYSDLFVMYFLFWGKLFYFMFFLLEEAARLALAFYVCYLIIFEVHSVNCSYSEDNFISTKVDTKSNY